MAKLLTDSQLSLLVSNIMQKIKAKEATKIAATVQHPKLSIEPLRKAAQAYLKERDKVLAVGNDLVKAGYDVNSYNQPDNVSLSDFDLYASAVNEAYTKQKSKHRSNKEITAIENTIKADLLRESLRVDDLNKALTAIEKKYGVG